jgi:hypothetical protein
VELVLDDGVGSGVLRRDEALRGDHGDVPFLRGGGRPRLDGGEEAVVVDVVVLLVVDVVLLVGAVRVEVVVIAVGRGRGARCEWQVLRSDEGRKGGILGLGLGLQWWRRYG